MLENFGPSDYNAEQQFDRASSGAPYSEKQDVSNQTHERPYRIRYRYTEREKKIFCPMGLIITMQNQHGLVFCGDSRSTFFDSIATPYQETQRQTQKVFQAKNYIVATYGRSMAIHRDTAVYMENLLTYLITVYPDMLEQEFLNRLYTEIRDSFGSDTTAPYHFLLGKIEGKMPMFYECAMSAVGPELVPRIESRVIYYGVADAAPHNVRVNENWSVNDLEKSARMLMQSTIDIGDRFFAYNPVGGKIQVAKLAVD